MISITLKKKAWRIPDRWGELTPADGPRFVAMSSAMASFEEGLITFDEFRVRLTLAAAGIRKVPEITDTMAENVYRLSELLTYPYRLSERPDGSRVAEIDVVLSENLLPELHRVAGYRFHRDPSGKMDCSLTAEQYIDALSLLQAHRATRQPSALQDIVRVLYPGVKGVTPDEARAVAYNFRGILAWIRSIPSYALIFATEETASAPAKNPVGLAASVYTLAKAGYGSIAEVKGLPLFGYLDLLLQQTVESIRTLAASKLTPTKIAERLALPTDLICDYIPAQP